MTMDEKTPEVQNRRPIEIPAEILNPERERIAHSAVGFARITVEGNEEDAELAGSGTLVQINGDYAVLTADHVAERLPKSGDLGLVLLEISGSKRSRFTIDASSIEYIKIGRGESEENGPDLGVIFLSEHDAERVNAYKVFYNIDKRSDDILKELYEFHLGIWVLIGMVGERTSEIITEAQFERVRKFSGMSAEFPIVREFSDDEFDYLDFEVDYTKNYSGPKSYKGFSGGGLWQIVVGKKKNGDLRVVDTILSGVAFYQSDLVDGKRTIRCHGRESIYRKACEVAATSRSQAPH